MIFNSQKQHFLILTLKIDNVVNERVAKFYFVGLSLDEHLTWNCHLNKISNKTFQCMGILNILKYFLPIQTTFTIL